MGEYNPTNEQQEIRELKRRIDNLEKTLSYVIGKLEWMGDDDDNKEFKGIHEDFLNRI